MIMEKSRVGPAMVGTRESPKCSHESSGGPGGRNGPATYGSEAVDRFENLDDHRHLGYMSEEFDPADYSFVVKRRGNPSKPWRWEIYCACCISADRALTRLF